MKVPALVLGIIGTLFVLLILLPASLMALSPDVALPPVYPLPPSDPLLVINAVLVFIFLILGIVGCSLVKSHSKASGIILICASASSIISLILISIALNYFFGFIIIPLFFLFGGITVLVPEKPLSHNNSY